MKSRITHRISLALVVAASAATATTACSSSADEAVPTTRSAPGEQLASGEVTTNPASPPADGNGAPPVGNGAGSFGVAPASAPIAPGSAPSAERQVVAKLGLGQRFLIGLGNDSTGDAASQTHAYGLGQKLDLHYMYLSGLDWPEWNLPAGSYVGMHANAARDRGIVPMFTLYQAASYGENNLGAFNTADFMTKYWRGVRVMLQQLAAFDAPAVVHIEPDLWGYTQKKNEEPSGVPMQVGSLVPECVDLPADVSGMAKCVIRLSRQIAPKVVIGLSASTFGATTNGVPDASRVATYMKKIGADQADIVVLETLDRDAGCFESGSDPKCQRAGQFYWDEANVAHPNFHDHLAWAKTIRTGIGKPLLWWQMPLGVPAVSAGSAGHYRDNRVRYLFSHAAEFAAAGGIGAVFGAGAPNQTDVTTDGGQFKNAVTGYYAAPATLP